MSNGGYYQLSSAYGVATLAAPMTQFPRFSSRNYRPNYMKPMRSEAVNKSHVMAI